MSTFNRRECVHLGGIINVDGSEPLHMCAIHGQCVVEGGTPTLKACRGCSEFVSVRDRGLCVHRGPVLRTGLGKLCGMRGKSIPIFACDLHGECTHGRFCHMQKERVCLGCSDFDELPKGFRPVDEQIPEQRKPNLLITVAIGEQYQSVLSVSQDLMERYAERCNADFIVLENRTQSWGMYEKFRVQKFAEVYDKTLFVDVDCLIKPWCVDMFEVLPPNHVALHNDRPFCPDADWMLRAWGRIMRSQNLSREPLIPESIWNTGVVLCDRSTAHIWSPPEKPLPGGHEDEQIWIQSTIEATGVKVISLPRIFNEQWYCQDREPGMTVDRWNKLAEESSILHFALCPDRVKHMKEWRDKIE